MNIMANITDVLGIEKLNDGANFPIWKLQVRALFKANGSINIVDGKEEKPTDDPTKEQEWLKMDGKAQKVIVTTIHKKYLNLILNCDYSSEMYEKISTLFEGEKEQKLEDLFNEFFSYQYKEGQDMTTFVGELENIVYKLKALKQTVSEEMVMSRILVALPEYLKKQGFPAAWDSTSKAEKTLTNLTNRLVKEEARHKEINKIDTTEVSVAFNSVKGNCSTIRKDDAYGKRCFICNGINHIARFCQNKNKVKNRVGNKPSYNNKHQQQKSRNENMCCSICKKRNHTESSCYFRDANKNKSDKVSFMATQNSNKEEVGICDFVVDSGCNKHLVNNANLFTDLKEDTSGINTAKKDESMKSVGEGEVITENFVLNKALYVPDLSTNLLSVSEITNKNMEVLFTQNVVQIRKNGKNILQGKKQSNGLYTVKSNSDNEVALISNNNNKNSSEIWHKRMGHPSYKSMKKLVNLVDGIKIDANEFDKIDCDKKICEVCVKAKQTRLPFNTVRDRAKRVLGIIHTDVIGPFETETWDHKRYLLTILDDYTHFAAVFLIRRKSEVFECLKNYITQIEIEKSEKVSVIRLDGGGEYTSNEMKSWCKEKGIFLNYTIPGTPQLNGRSERFGRTLVNKMRALLYESKLNNTMWGESAYCAVYILNRSYSETVGVTPAELWQGKRPDLSNLRIFGCTAFIKKIGHLKKLEERSIKTKFIGYFKNGYRVWDPVNKKVILSRDVIFDENDTIFSNDEQYNCQPLIIQWEDEENNVNNGEETKEEDEEEPQNKTNHEEETSVQNENNNKRSTRTKKIPSKYDDFVMLTYTEAVNCEDKLLWIDAIEEEKKSLNKNNVFKFVKREEVKDKKPLSSKWIFKVKSDGQHKARLVVRGCEQTEDEFGETFSPVVSVSTLRLLLAYSKVNNMKLSVFDVKTAFLYGYLEEELYMELPQGYDEWDGHIAKLEKSLYGLKQGPIQWNKRLVDILLRNKLKQLLTDKSVFINEDGSLIVAIWVDDGIIISNCENEINKLLNELETEFDIKKINNPKSFVGFDIINEEKNIVLHQSDYTTKLLKHFNMELCKSVKTPTTVNNSNESKSSEKENIKFPFREAVGSLLYLSTRTRPDITYAVNMVSRNMENPTDKDVQDVKRIFRYLQGTINQGIKYQAEEGTAVIEAFTDSDYAGDEKSRKSTSGNVIMYAGGPISWKTKKQNVVSLSSAESEYIASSDCVRDVLFIKSLFKELTTKDMLCKVKIDNQSTIKMIQNSNFKRSKHIDIRYKFIVDNIENKNVSVEFCPTDRQLADILTKPNPKHFDVMRDKIMCKIEN